jgi:hypothetical protein
MNLKSNQLTLLRHLALFGTVIDKLNSGYIIAQNGDIRLDSKLFGRVQEDYINGDSLNHGDIRNPRNYMRQCIWTVLSQGRLSL